MLSRTGMSGPCRALVLVVAALLAVSCGSKRSNVASFKAFSGPLASKLAPRSPSPEPNRPPSRPAEDASSSGVAAAQPVDERPAKADGAANSSSPAWTVTTIRNPPPASTSSAQQQYPRPKLSAKLAFAMRGRNGLAFLVIAGAAILLLILLLVRRRAPG